MERGQRNWLVTCGSVGKVLPAVLAPLIILELRSDPSWVGIYFGLTAFAALIGQLGSGADTTHATDSIPARASWSCPAACRD
jgi:hypothetical protein